MTALEVWKRPGHGGERKLLPHASLTADTPPHHSRLSQSLGSTPWATVGSCCVPTANWASPRTQTMVCAST